MSITRRNKLTSIVTEGAFFSAPENKSDGGINMKENYEKTYSIGDASRITGVSQRKLRSWEGKHIPKPERIVCGERAYRRYTQALINLITRINEYQNQGFTLLAAAKKANDDLARKGGNG